MLPDPDKKPASTFVSSQAKILCLRTVPTNKRYFFLGV